MSRTNDKLDHTNDVPKLAAKLADDPQVEADVLRLSRDGLKTENDLLRQMLFGKEGPNLVTDLEWSYSLSDDDGDDNYHLKFYLTDDGQGGDNSHRQFMEAYNQVSDTEWHHLAAVIDLSYGDDDNVKFFTDAVQATSHKEAGNYMATVYAGTASLRFGETERLSGAGEQLGGTMGEVRIYNRALTPLEIQHNYLATKWRYK